ncbi:aminoglycoside phosphotransferase family protein [Aurantiacibacter gangjinensis]|uniref:Aminoglycoside phosphotransferase n=1 Tax=Aurantiacibacter gangjinensis TaxID=502682 RepID=A0A0G9MR05_9SPHN|nr:phosphotransferase [Aurantiacibacter gangjinensis]APE28918.1 putative phosphotransferase related to Ser/Thr protein kinase [Aurantiacibacter gangjinensis]KLE33044.1 aminoglycoside phosphotransferase [Aurantiacibacter gangjinensis]
MNDLPEGIRDFLGKAGWSDAVIEPIPGDASFRRYFRLRRGDGTAMLMYARPPEEDPRPFLHVARWLSDHNMRAPAILSEDAQAGWVLTEDFGNDRMRDWLDIHPQEEHRAYQDAVDALVALHNRPAGPFDPYSLETYLREVSLLPDWFCPAAGIEVDSMGFLAAWREALGPLLLRQQPGVTVLRDYHAENIMLLGPEGQYSGEQGLIDFQDALSGHPAYDLVSLLQDARRDVSPQLEQAMLNHYRSRIDTDPDFEADYARLGAQRNAKIVGIFARLWKRDGKDRYLAMIPRVWEAMERDLEHPALAPVAAWFDANIPADTRARRGAISA